MYKNKRAGVVIENGKVPRNSKEIGTFGMIIMIIILIVIVLSTNTNNSNLSILENGISKLVMPVQNGYTYFKNTVLGNTNFFVDVKNLKEENQKLKETNSKLEQEVRELEIIKAENETLKEYAGLVEKYSEYETIPANIVNKDITNFTDVVIINVGSKDGINVDMPVIAESGLVGYIISTTDHTAKVQTIIDTSSAITAAISTTKESILVRGTLTDNSTLKGTYIPTTANIIEGDKVQTSGIGGIYPKGIHIGTIEKVVDTKNITDRYIKIKTAVDFTTLETVLVVK